MATSVGAFTPTESVGLLTMKLIDGRWADSQTIIQAISTQGKTSLVTSTSVTTLNNKVAPVQVTTQENYVSKTTIEKDNYSSGNGSTSVEMDTDTLNYGFTMEILLRILDNGRLIVLFSMTLTDLLSLTTFSSDGSSSGDKSTEDDDDNEDTGDEKTVVQLPKMQTRGFVQEIAMRSGSTLVLTGFETVQNKTDTAGIGKPKISILGGKAYATQNRNVLVILLTPEILVSPLQPETRMENF
jgi:type IVB pilus formation R64 PilN family outer membrane protein